MGVPFALRTISNNFPAQVEIDEPHQPLTRVATDCPPDSDNRLKPAHWV
jgi:hypothetical protein